MRPTTSITAPILSGPASLRRAAWTSLAKLAKRAWLAYEISRERRALMTLSDHQLKDIGLSRSQAFREGSRSVFDLPAGRDDIRRVLPW